MRDMSTIREVVGTEGETGGDHSFRHLSLQLVEVSKCSRGEKLYLKYLLFAPVLRFP